jgi:hypothetical protein
VKVELKASEVLRLVRHVIQVGNLDAAVALIDDVLPQVEAWEQGGGAARESGAT